MNAQPRRFLLAGDGNFLAHMSRLTEIGRVLRDRHAADVVVAASGPFTWLPRGAGFPIEPLYTVPGDFTLDAVKRLGLVRPSRIREHVVPGLADDLDVLRRVQPDAVVTDMRWTMGLAGAIAGVPVASVINAFWTRYCTVPIPAPPGHALTTLLGARLAAKVCDVCKPALTRFSAGPYREAAAAHGLPPERVADLYDLMEGDLVLLADTPEFGATSGLPAHHHYVGPILWESAWDDWVEPDWLRDLDPARPLVYVTMGSTGDAHVFEELAKGLGGDVEIVMTTAGTKVDAALPSNVHVLDFAPGSRIMARSALVVSHGGNGTLNQAIAAGCPVIGVPTHVDQALNIARAEALGFGLTVLPGRDLGRRLGVAIRTVLADGAFRAAAERLAVASRRYDGAVGAAALIDGLVRGAARDVA